MGLTQVMPATGGDIAARLNDAVYTTDQLLRPSVGVRYGVYYLGKMLDSYERDWIAALVAYNAGPGNLKRWTGGQPIADHDLFYETIPITQTQDYVRMIYQQYRIYEYIYHQAQ